MSNSYKITPEKSADGKIVNLFSTSPDGRSKRSLYNDRDTQRYKMYKEYFEKNPKKSSATTSEIELAMGASSYKVAEGPQLVELGPMITNKPKEVSYPVSKEKAEEVSTSESLSVAAGIVGNIINDVTVKPLKNAITGDKTYNRPAPPKPVEGYGSAADENSPLGTSTTDPKNFDYSTKATVSARDLNRWYKEETSDGAIYWASQWIGTNADGKPVYVYRIAEGGELLEAIKRKAGDYQDPWSPGDVESGEWSEDEYYDKTVVRPSKAQDEEIRSQSVKYHGIYNKYYSASDFRVYIGDILLDKASGVMINESLSSLPIYTIGNSRYDFLSRGNIIVSGFITINKSDKDYIARVLSSYRENGTVNFKSLSPYEQMQLTTEELAAYKKKEKQYKESDVSSKSVLDWADLEPFTINLVYNNADVITAGEDHRIAIIECRIVGYEHGVDISSDGQLIDGYKFIAKEVVPE